MSELSIKEAAELTCKSTDTIYRWKRKGVNIGDRAEILEYSQVQDIRARGKAREASLRRIEVPDGDHALHPYRSFFQSVIDPDEFVELPPPFSWESADRALALLREIQAAFARRLEELKAIGHQHSIEFAENELRQIIESYRILDTLLEGFPD